MRHPGEPFLFLALLRGAFQVRLHFAPRLDGLTHQFGFHPARAGILAALRSARASTLIERTADRAILTFSCCITLASMLVSHSLMARRICSETGMPSCSRTRRMPSSKSTSNRTFDATLAVMCRAKCIYIVIRRQGIFFKVRLDRAVRRSQTGTTSCASCLCGDIPVPAANRARPRRRRPRPSMSKPY